MVQCGYITSIPDPMASRFASAALVRPGRCTTQVICSGPPSWPVFHGKMRGETKKTIGKP